MGCRGLSNTVIDDWGSIGLGAFIRNHGGEGLVQELAHRSAGRGE
jgi:hypothetical protein